MKPFFIMLGIALALLLVGKACGPEYFDSALDKAVALDLQDAEDAARGWTPERIAR